MGFLLLHHSALSGTLAQLIQAGGFKDVGSLLHPLFQWPASFVSVPINQACIEGGRKFFRTTLRESCRVLDLCVWVGDLSLHGLTPKEGKAGWSRQEMRDVKWCEEASAGTCTKNQY